MIYFIIGTKAQVVKVAPVMVAVRRARLPYRTIFTGQHHETIAELMDDFGLPKPDITLYDGPDIVKTSQLPGWFVRVMWTFLRHRRRYIPPGNNIVLVHGDTASTVLGAFMGRLTRCRVAHLESGLRSFKLFNPFPEEMQRLVTFRLSNIYFCPGEWALRNVRQYRGDKIDTHYNTLLDSVSLAVSKDAVPDLAVPSQPFCLISMHRYENISRQQTLLRNIRIIERIAADCYSVFVLHPSTVAHLHKHGLFERLRKNPRIELRPRTSYVKFLQLLTRSEFMVTDGGSNQEECYYLGHPCLLLRSVTERQEGIGANVVISEYREERINEFIRQYIRYRKPPIRPIHSPSERIVGYLEHFFG